MATKKKAASKAARTKAAQKRSTKKTAHKKAVKKKKATVRKPLSKSKSAGQVIDFKNSSVGIAYVVVSCLKSAMRQKILNLLLKNPNGLTGAQIAEKIKKQPALIHSHLHHLRIALFVTVKRNGKSNMNTVDIDRLNQVLNDLKGIALAGGH